MEHADVRVQVETLQELARQLDEDVAFRVWELRPTAIQDEGLHSALTNYVRNWSKQLGSTRSLHTGCAKEDRLPSLIEITMYRLAQEALNNVAKHARASHVDIVFERIADQWSLIIEDNGIGFDPSSGEVEHRGFGLAGMRERAALVGAELQIESALVAARPSFPGHPRLQLRPGVLDVSRTLRILVADDHAVVRQGLKLLINSQPDMTVVGEAADGAAVLQQAAAVEPDIVVMDLSMPGMNGLVATRGAQEGAALGGSRCIDAPRRRDVPPGGAAGGRLGLRPETEQPHGVSVGDSSRGCRRRLPGPCHDAASCRRPAL